MKKAFTMIELIFVIVILGILAAVALPKFLSVSQQAHEGNLKAFVGTLNRSVGPTIWSKAVSANGTGSVTALTGDEQNLSSFVDIPTEIKNSNLTDSNLTADCNSSTNDQIILYAKKDVAGHLYFITCRDGNPTQSLKFRLYQASNDNMSVSSSTIGTDINSTDANATCIAGCK